MHGHIDMKCIPAIFWWTKANDLYEESIFDCLVCKEMVWIQYCISLAEDIQIPKRPFKRVNDCEKSIFSACRLKCWTPNAYGFQWFIRSFICSFCKMYVQCTCSMCRTFVHIAAFNFPQVLHNVFHLNYRSVSLSVFYLLSFFTLTRCSFFYICLFVLLYVCECDIFA